MPDSSPMVVYPGSRGTTWFVYVFICLIGSCEVDWFCRKVNLAVGTVFEITAFAGNNDRDGAFFNSLW